MDPRSAFKHIVLLSMFLVASVAHQTDGCGQSLTAPTGEIASPGHPDQYTNDLDCVWTVRVPDGHTIDLVIAELELDSNDTHCLDWLEIRDGPTENSSLLVRACNACPMPHIIHTTGPHAYLRFQSDDVFHHSGFLLKYSQQPSRISSGHQRGSSQPASNVPLMVGLIVGVPLLIIAVILIIVIVCLTIKNERLHRDAA